MTNVERPGNGRGPVGNGEAASFHRSSNWPAPSSSLAAKNAEEFWLGNYSRGIAKNVNDGEPAQNVTRTGIVSTIQIPHFPLSPIG